MVLLQYPKAVVFDLDYTLWPLWCDTHIYMPISALSRNELVDSNGMKISFYKDVESIILELVENEVVLIAASRTATPKIAQELLSLLHIGGKPAITYFHSLQWGQGSKVKHISKAAEDLRLQSALQEGHFMLFDDELRNRDVGSINCHFAYVYDENQGLTRSIFISELKKWSKSLNTR